MQRRLAAQLAPRSELRQGRTRGPLRGGARRFDARGKGEVGPAGRRGGEGSVPTGL